jgi:hypothetical protein
MLICPFAENCALRELNFGAVIRPEVPDGLRRAAESAGTRSG